MCETRVVNLLHTGTSSENTVFFFGRVDKIPGRAVGKSINGMVYLNTCCGN